MPSLDALSDEDIAEFQEIYRRAFNEDLSAGEARIMAGNLLELYSVLARPLPSELGSNQTQSPDPPENTGVSEFNS